jgi:hypothetical protein
LAGHFLGKALLLAASDGQVGVVRVLLDFGADKDVQNEHDLAPLMCPPDVGTWMS